MNSLLTKSGNPWKTLAKFAEKSNMTPESKLICGIIILTVPTIVYGGMEVNR